MPCSRRVGAAEVEVKRGDTRLNIEVSHDQPVPVAFEHPCARPLEFLKKRRVEARQRERHIRILEGVGHPADAIVMLDEEVPASNVSVGRLLGRPERVAHDLEDAGKRRQREHDHHEPADARRLHEPVGRVGQVLLQVPIEERLALLLQPHRRVELGRRARRHQPPQEADECRRHIHVNHEVGTGETEEHVDPLAR